MTALIIPQTPLSVTIVGASRDRPDTEYRNLIFDVLQACGFRGAWTCRFYKKIKMSGPQRVKISRSTFGFALEVKPAGNDSSALWKITPPKEYTVQDIQERIRLWLQDAGRTERLPDTLIAPEPVATEIDETPAATPAAASEVFEMDTNPLTSDTGELTEQEIASCAGFINDEEILAACFQAWMPHLDADNCIHWKLACELTWKTLFNDLDATQDSGAKKKQKTNLGSSIRGLHSRKYIVITEDAQYYELTKRARDLVVKHSGQPLAKAAPATNSGSKSVVDMLQIVNKLEAAKAVRDRKISYDKLNQPQIQELKKQREHLQKQLQDTETRLTALEAGADFGPVPSDEEIAALEAEVAPMRALIASLMRGTA